MKLKFLILLLVYPLFECLSQDKIILKTKEVVDCKVERIGLDVVSYRRADNPNGPLYDIKKQDISSILYENGRADVFENENFNEAPTNVSENRNTNVISNCYQDLIKVELHDDYLRYRGTKPYQLTFDETYNLMNCFDNSISNAYRHFYKMDRVGNSLIGVGTITSAIGVCLIATNNEGEKYSESQEVAGVMVLSMGLSSVATGIPLKAVGLSNKKRKVKEFYQKYGETSYNETPTLNLLYKGNGFSLVLEF